MELLDTLRRFNRKERFFLVGSALGNPRFELSTDFRENLNSELGISIPVGAICAMDYHLDWLHASFAACFSENSSRVYQNADKFITANQEDIDLLIAYQQDDLYHIVLLEAKGVTGWNNEQLISKAMRFKQIFSTSVLKRVKPHFALVSPKNSSGIQVDEWPEWMHRDRKPAWLKLEIPGNLLRVSRCDPSGKALAAGTHWTILDDKI